MTFSAVSANYYSGNVPNSGKVYVPVKPMAVVYTQFDHVSGYAARAGQRGISVNRARILNSLIDQLVTMKAQTSSGKEITGKEGISDEQLDAMISQYQAEVKSALDAARQIPYGLGGAAAPDAGLAFSISA